MRFKRDITYPLALVLALVLSLALASVVRADPQPLAKAEGANASSQSSPKPTVRSNPDEQGTTYAHRSSTGSGTEVANDRSQSSATASTTIARVTSHTGFDWGDASIGAAAGMAFSMIGLSLLALAAQRRARRSRQAAAAVAN